MSPCRLCPLCSAGSLRDSSREGRQKGASWLACAPPRVAYAEDAISGRARRPQQPKKRQSACSLSLSLSLCSQNRRRIEDPTARTPAVRGGRAGEERIRYSTARATPSVPRRATPGHAHLSPNASSDAYRLSVRADDAAWRCVSSVGKSRSSDDKLTEDSDTSYCTMN